MQTSSTLPELFHHRSHWSRPVAFVPTMGALHPGHLALVELARKTVGPDGTVVVSIFVNPLQFDREKDLFTYPRTLESDLDACKQAGVSHVFHPSKEDFYHPDHSIHVMETSLSRSLCGATRPGHFDGVCTVVLKLFNAINPDYAIFGKKDYQQLAIINRLVRDLALGVEIVPAETFRDSDGLALSSRNRNLTDEQRADAPRIRRSLLATRDLKKTGEQNPAAFLQTARHLLLKGAPADFKIDYLELVSQTTLQPLAKIAEPALLATACFYGDVRLIDNIEI